MTLVVEFITALLTPSDTPIDPPSLWLNPRRPSTPMPIGSTLIPALPLMPLLQFWLLLAAVAHAG